MPQVIKDIGIGERLGSSIGTGLGQGLSNLANLKLQEMQRQKQQQQLQQAGLPGVLAHLDPQVQAAYLREYGASQQRNQQEEEQSMLQNLLGGIESQAQAPQQSEEISLTETLKGVTGVPSEVVTEQVAEKVVSQRPAKLPPGARAERERELLQKRLDDPKISASQKANLRAQLEKRHEKLEKQQDKIDSSTKDFYKDTVKEGRSATNSDKRLSQMERLIQKGNLTNPVFASLLETVSKGVFGFGVDLFSLTNPDTQQFRKLSTDFLKEAKSIFGSRLTDADIKYFLQTVPTLTVDNDGKMALIENMRSFNAAKKIRQEAMEAVVEEHGGHRPKNLQSMVEKRIKPQLDKLADEFMAIGDERKPIAPTQPISTSFVKATGLDAILDPIVDKIVGI